MTHHTEPALDPRAFRRALGNFATGVTVVTAATADGTRVGVTANSFNSVSLDPPLVLWSIDKRSGSYAIFEQASHFAINVLAADQMDISNRFARPSEDKFAGIEVEVGAGDVPLLTDCAARFQCEKYQQVDGGDHWILIGKVVAFDDLGRAPLVYHQGSYSMVLPYPQVAERVAQNAVGSARQERLNNNVFYLLTQALRSYQSSYQPKQLSTGLRASEARMLLVLDSDACLDKACLLAEMAMPTREIEEAQEALYRKGLVSSTENGHHLTEAGERQASVLRDIAAKQQEQVLSAFSADEVGILKKLLRGIIANSQ
ncbi:flavin reductase family protein [Serratia fonticola]|jgi:flavin reductase (DIM6/NTAB) family NADH-FMN oxidoreductase RutF/DNA-binding MarR family transcriptional regulator|uniref:p-hydroxyphenylacetate 3-hydroxylase reductase component n=1 Tax=Serratia TaxID=613 RepID=UPI0008FD4B9B|nr:MULTISPECIES: flavin reductase family protein [Serratia]MBC3250815.1 flavin reductase family protein [Serratia fonticola]MBP1036771.1 flavin reductase family protein [Serratia fonticola]NYA45891.1 flavin reductase family protein [Serratia fonticola]OIX95498.1 flavin oxidoreductase [Serratia fonticola]QCR62004.1 flavin reductase family protein [Serratia fonticola]